MVVTIELQDFNIVGLVVFIEVAKSVHRIALSLVEVLYAITPQHLPHSCSPGRVGGIEGILRPLLCHLLDFTYSFDATDDFKRFVEGCSGWVKHNIKWGDSEHTWTNKPSNALPSGWIFSVLSREVYSGKSIAVVNVVKQQLGHLSAEMPLSCFVFHVSFNGAGLFLCSVVLRIRLPTQPVVVREERRQVVGV